MTRPPEPRSVNSPRHCSHHSDDRFQCFAPPHLYRVESALVCQIDASKGALFPASADIQNPSVHSLVRILSGGAFGRLCEHCPLITLVIEGFLYSPLSAFPSDERHRSIWQRGILDSVV
jgi:hypothetical protein